jgi:DNA polymerase
VNDLILQCLHEEIRWSGRFLIVPLRENDFSGDEPRHSSLDDLRSEVLGCSRCPLGKSVRNKVFGEGDIRADVMFIGEAPGAVEDETGRPFVGPAGELLTKIIHSMGLNRENVYIANIIKCRPPGNRDPLPDELLECIGFLKEQIRLVEPKVIIALGRIAAQELLGTQTPISKLRGSFHDYNGINMMPTYHPSYLLHNPAKKRDVWEDIKKVMARLDLALPKQP